MKIRKFTIYIVSLLIINVPLNSPIHALLTPKEELEIGERFLKSINLEYEIADYPYIVNYINELGHYIGSFVEVPYFPLNFYIIQDNDINAFAAPAGHVFFFSGIISMMENVDELASVLAHELGHVSARHLAARIERSKKIGLATMAGILAGVLIGGDAAGALMTGSMAAGIQAELGYSREDERQADQLGYKYTNMAGFNPEGMITTLKKIQSEGWHREGSVPSYLLTHPGAAERMTNIEVMLKEYSDKPELGKAKKFRSQFPIFHTMVVALCNDKEHSKRRFKKILLDDDKSAVAHYGMGLILERSGFPEEAISHFKIALEQKPESIPIIYSIAKSYQDMGKYDESIASLQKALDLSPKDKAVLKLFALSLQKLELYDRAAVIFNRLTYLAPVEDSIYYHLGVVYGRQDKLKLAHYNLGIYFTRLKQKEKARFHFKKAQRLTEGDQVLQEKIDSALNELDNQ